MPFPNPDTQFKPGNTAGAAGRPRGKSVTARLHALLEKGEINGKPLKDGKQVADLLAEVILRQALKGDHRFVTTLLERVEGKVPNKIAVEPPKPLEDMTQEELDAFNRSLEG